MHPAISNIKSKLDALAQRAGVPPVAIYSGVGIATLVSLSLLAGLASAGHHQPQAVAVQQAQPRAEPAPARPSAPQQPAPQQVQAASSATVASFALPALASPPPGLSPGVGVELDFINKDAPPQRVGSAALDAQTASLPLAAPSSMAGFVPVGKPIQLVFSGYFRVDQAGGSILFAKLGGPQSAGVILQVDGRADPVLSVQRSVNIWDGPGPATQANSQTIHLQPGWHQLTIVAQTVQPAPGQADTLDLFIKSSADTLPVALQLLHPGAPATSASAPAQAVASAPKGASK